MSQLSLEEKLRKEMQKQFNLRPQSKKRKSPSNKSNEIANSKQKIIAEFKDLGLIKPPLPERDNTWKQPKKKKTNHQTLNKRPNNRPKKKRKMNTNNSNHDNINIDKLHPV